MHDFTGTMRADDEADQESTASAAHGDTSNNSNRAAAISLQELATGSNALRLEHPLLQNQRQDDTLTWTQEWPFWGHEHLMPFADGGLAFDFNVDFPIGQPFS